MDVITLENVSVSFDGNPVLGNISLSIRRGETFVIIGPSGHGKTTLLKTLSGLVTPQNGKVFFEQREWLTLSKKDRLGILKKMGVLFQKNALFDSLTCIENICFPLRETSDLDEAEIIKTAERFLEAVGISHARDLFPDEISGGMQKRLGIARALAVEPEIIFYDDPTAGLDPITAKKIIELILELKAQKSSTVLAITNDMNRAFQMADRIGMVVDGELLITGTPEETKNHQDLRVHQFIRGSLEGPLAVVE